MDEAALITTLEEGKVAGAATDVFCTEPAGGKESVLVRKAGEWEQRSREGAREEDGAGEGERAGEKSKKTRDKHKIKHRST